MRAWHLHAACVDADDVFFSKGVRAQTAALEICGRCAARAECLAEAMADESLDHGIRGGLTAAARKARRKADAKRGTS